MLGRPRVDTLNASAFKNLKELGIQLRKNFDGDMDEAICCVLIK
jgi:hypothetical protein